MFILTSEQIVHPMPPAVNSKKLSLPLRRRINVELARRGWRQDRLAIEVGRARNTVNRAINHGENGGTLLLVLNLLGIRP